MIDYNSMEAKWQKSWEDAKIFEREPDGRSAYEVTAAFPYANMPQHIGHLRTYGTADALARYKRMRGFNVIYPMAIHGSGTPVIAIAKRMEEKDKDLIETLKLYGVGEDVMARMTDPEFIIDYFAKELEAGMHAAGYSIDWRRKFVSTEPFFSKFIEWQFGILNGKGYLTKGKHPVGWCPKDNNAVGMHDTKHDVEPEIEEQVAIKFKVSDGDAKILCATYRPETIHGVTNIFINCNASYALCEINGEKCYVSEQAARELGNQIEIKLIEIVGARELLSKTCVNPANNDTLPILPGFFVKADRGTGAVMSVPAHAPFDYAALQRLKAEGYAMPEIIPKKIIDVKIGRSLSDVTVGDAKPEHVDLPALAYLEILHTDVNAIEDMLEFATKLQYREESHWGKMLVPGYEGMSEPEAREKIKQALIGKGEAMPIFTLTNGPVYCRCGEKVVVKILDDQWFINYGDASWKELTKEAFDSMRILPPKLRNTYAAAIDWINLRAVARSRGLGTKFPLDKKYIIESLSDSTIYPAFYTISHIIRNVPVESLTPEFFDYVFKGKGDLDGVAKATGIDYATVKRCRESFTYWYKDTSRHSGSDLVFNHLTMYIFNHVAIFDKEYWPKQIVTNALVNYEGEKMSKSLGNIVPLLEGLKKYGADPLRLIEVAGTDLFTDSEFSVEALEGVKARLQYVYDAIENADSLGTGELRHIDYWLYSKLNTKIGAATKAMDDLELRDASIEMLYNSVNELKRYFAHGGKNSLAVKDYLTGVALMLQPMAPHFSEEAWHALGNDTFASVEKWPEADKSMISEVIEQGEDLVDKTVNDARQVIAMMQKKSGKKAAALRIIIADDWKRNLTNIVAKDKNIENAINSAKSDDSLDKAAAAQYVGSLAKRAREITEVRLMQHDEFESFSESAEYMGRQLGCKVTVEKESASNSERAGRAGPLKPSLDITL
ncbi:Leucine--tRNA ligase [uncultured archaeon]|nr:Leucine--tRNA ligase [uncultured archaeon]